MNRLNKDIFNIIYRLSCCGQIKQTNIEYHNKFKSYIKTAYNGNFLVIRVKNSHFGLCFNYRSLIDQIWDFSKLYHWNINLIPPQMTQTSYKLPKNY